MATARRRGCATGLIVFVAAAALAPEAVHAQHRDLPLAPARADFSAVTSKAAARRLARQGRLVAIHFFPRELGGPDDPLNIGYVPPEAVAALAQVTAMLASKVRLGLIDRLGVQADYKGASFIPSRIRFYAWHSARPGGFETAVAIW